MPTIVTRHRDGTVSIDTHAYDETCDCEVCERIYLSKTPHYLECAKLDASRGRGER